MHTQVRRVVFVARIWLTIALQLNCANFGWKCRSQHWFDWSISIQHTSLIYIYKFIYITYTYTIYIISSYIWCGGAVQEMRLMHLNKQIIFIIPASSVCVRVVHTALHEQKAERRFKHYRTCLDFSRHGKSSSSTRSKPARVFDPRIHTAELVVDYYYYYYSNSTRPTYYVYNII